MSKQPSRIFGFAASGLVDSADQLRQNRLTRLIEREIIPRMLICHTAMSRARGAVSTPAPTPADVAELARLMLDPDRELAESYLRTLRVRGASRGLICAELLAPTAKRLGDLWERDECDFAELTDGLRRLESVLEAYRHP